MVEGEGSDGQTCRFSLREKLARLFPARFKPSHPQAEATPPPTTEPLQSSLQEKHKDEPQEAPLPKREVGVAKMLFDELKTKKLTIPEISSGVAAIISTNEGVGDGFFEAVQAKNPDGYIVGVGAGNAFTMLHCFQEGVIPAGIILSDINPGVVAAGKLLIKKLKEATDSTDLQKKFFGMSRSEFNSLVERLIWVEEEDDVLKAEWQKMTPDTWQEVYELLSKKEYLSWKDIRAYEYEGQNIDVVGAMLDKFAVLKQLATEDNVAIAYADFTDPSFIEAVKALPNFNSLRNIIYYSNITDHITHRGTRMKNLKAIENLFPYEAVRPYPVFIDTLGSGLNYFLRATHIVPTYSAADFAYRGIQPRDKKPEGLLFDPI